ncbi:hypothetical protein MKX03_016801 [Papaver bracteatum]|nr:hypothetical protein MKX03_016801 [Papaver bracteatum]
MNEHGSEAGATPPTEAEACAQVLKKKQRRCCATTTDSDTEVLHDMLQALHAKLRMTNYALRMRLSKR